MRETVPSIYKLRKKLEEKMIKVQLCVSHSCLLRASGRVDLCAVLNGYLWIHQIHKNFENRT